MRLRLISTDLIRKEILLLFYKRIALSGSISEDLPWYKASSCDSRLGRRCAQLRLAWRAYFGASCRPRHRSRRGTGSP
jgi:hypothetical protein